jgi:hypothetical protein
MSALVVVVATRSSTAFGLTTVPAIITAAAAAFDIAPPPPPSSLLTLAEAIVERLCPNDGAVLVAVSYRVGYSVDDGILILCCCDILSPRRPVEVFFVVIRKRLLSFTGWVSFYLPVIQ